MVGWMNIFFIHFVHMLYISLIYEEFEITLNYIMIPELGH